MLLTYKYSTVVDAETIFTNPKKPKTTAKKTKFLDLVANVPKKTNSGTKRNFQIKFFSLSIKFFSSLGNERFGSFFGTELKSPPMFG